MIGFLRRLRDEWRKPTPPHVYGESLVGGLKLPFDREVANARADAIIADFVAGGGLLPVKTHRIMGVDAPDLGEPIGKRA